MSEPKTSAELPEQPETEAETGGHPIHGRDEAVYEPNLGRDPTGQTVELPDRQDPADAEETVPDASGT